ncbi:MAG: sulfurtransferase complex subunit TusD [Cellvibrionaceae bacterium]
MKFIINIYCSPSSLPAAKSAFRFAETLLDEGHEIYRIFFFNEGVLHCINSTKLSSLTQQWQTLIQQHNLDAVICSASAEKRGISLNGENIPLDGFIVSGLGQLIDGINQSDRLITFG